MKILKLFSGWITGWIKRSNNIMAVATIFLAGATFWLGYETRELKLVDIGPNISISDVILELVNEGGTPRKEISWKDGELLNKGAVNDKLTDFNMAMRFKNTGKNAGYIKLLKITDIISQKPIYINNSSSTPILDVFQLVPANGETGLIYPIDINKIPAKIKEINSNYKIIEIEYNFEIYDKNLSIKDKLYSFVIRCSELIIKERGKQYYCEPVKY